jgi:hypothetical protein
MRRHTAADGGAVLGRKNKEASVGPAERSSDRRRFLVLVLALVGVIVAFWLASPPRASAQIIDPGDIELPELPDPPDLPDLPDVDLPDVEVPDAPDVDPPGPPDVDPPGPPDVDPDDPEEPADESDPNDGSKKKEREKGTGDAASGGGDGPRSGGGGGGVPGPYPHLAAARGGGDLIITPSAPDSRSVTKPDDDGRSLLDLLAPLGFPMLLMVAVGSWLTLQDHMERKDPRRLPAAPDTGD